MSDLQARKYPERLCEGGTVVFHRTFAIRTAVQLAPAELQPARTALATP